MSLSIVIKNFTYWTLTRYGLYSSLSIAAVNTLTLQINRTKLSAVQFVKSYYADRRGTFFMYVYLFLGASRTTYKKGVLKIWVKTIVNRVDKYRSYFFFCIFNTVNETNENSYAKYDVYYSDFCYAVKFCSVYATFE